MSHTHIINAHMHTHTHIYIYCKLYQIHAFIASHTLISRQVSQRPWPGLLPFHGFGRMARSAFLLWHSAETGLNLTVSDNDLSLTDDLDENYHLSSEAGEFGNPFPGFRQGREHHFLQLLCYQLVMATGSRKWGHVTTVARRSTQHRFETGAWLRVDIFVNDGTMLIEAVGLSSSAWFFVAKDMQRPKKTWGKKLPRCSTSSTTDFNSAR